MTLVSSPTYPRLQVSSALIMALYRPGCKLHRPAPVTARMCLFRIVIDVLVSNYLFDMTVIAAQMLVQAFIA